MKLIVQPASHLQGRIALPASKSYSIRAFIVAACGGVSVIKKFSRCDDAQVALSVARQMGARISTVNPSAVRVAGSKVRKDSVQIHVKESGTVLRLLLPLLPLIGRRAKVTGEGTLVGRPNHHLAAALRAAGMLIRGTGAKESVPIAYEGGELDGGEVLIDGSLSSQFISAFLVACPQLEADTRLVIKGQSLVSTDYITMTRQILAEAGIVISKKHDRLYVIKGGQTFKGLKNFTVPSDHGLAAFLLAAGALTESRLVFEGRLDDQFLQADGRIFGFLKRMGVKWMRTPTAIRMQGPFALKGGTFSLKDCPDLVPIMAVLALFAKGPTRLTNIRHARAKESDRISDLRHELLKIGADVREKSDELAIVPRPIYAGNAALDPHRDHRLAMAFAVLGLKVGVQVKDIECVRKSYPEFVRDFRRMGAGAKQAG